MTSQQHQSAARELLAFYLEAGVDAPLGEAPVDRFAEPTPDAAPAPPAERPEPQMIRQRPVQKGPPLPTRTIGPSELDARAGASPPPSPEAAVMAARQQAKSAATLEELRALVERFEGCALRNTAKQLVFADGNPNSRLMFVGEAPGRDEDIEGLPFVGRSGKLLDRMIAAIGYDRTNVYIANIVPWRPPGNRTPTPQESAICLPFLQRQIELANPDVLVCLGGPSAQTLLNVKDGITRVRGRWYTFNTGTRDIKAVATFHPAFLLRSPLQKRFAWRDLMAIKKALAA
jgi:DNA polymerase